SDFIRQLAREQGKTVSLFKMPLMGGPLAARCALFLAPNGALKRNELFKQDTTIRFSEGSSQRRILGSNLKRKEVPDETA
ncbi:MAG: hypothetical protein AAF552_10600, partial [Pseudomonadota bacterium]